MAVGTELPEPIEQWIICKEAKAKCGQVGIFLADPEKELKAGEELKTTLQKGENTMNSNLKRKIERFEQVAALSGYGNLRPYSCPNTLVEAIKIAKLTVSKTISR